MKPINHNVYEMITIENGKEIISRRHREYICYTHTHNANNSRYAPIFSMPHNIRIHFDGTVDMERKRKKTIEGEREREKSRESIGEKNECAFLTWDQYIKYVFMHG